MCARSAPGAKVGPSRCAMNVFSRPDGFAQPGRGGRHAGDDHLFALSLLSPVEVCAGVGSTRDGLTASEAENRLRQFGLNLVTRERRATILRGTVGPRQKPAERAAADLGGRLLVSGRRARGRRHRRHGGAGDHHRVHPGAPVERGRRPAARHGAHHRQRAAQSAPSPTSRSSKFRWSSWCRAMSCGCPRAT